MGTEDMVKLCTFGFFNVFAPCFYWGLEEKASTECLATQEHSTLKAA